MNTTDTTTTKTTAAKTAATTQAELLALMSFGAPELVSEEFADARALEYVMAAGCCTTCLVDGEDVYASEAELAHLPACPTCGVRSTEWALARDIDDTVTALAGLTALDEAVDRA